MGNNLVLEGYLFHFLPTAVWVRSCGGSEMRGRHTSLNFGWSLPAERSLGRPNDTWAAARLPVLVFLVHVHLFWVS